MRKIRLVWLLVAFLCAPPIVMGADVATDTTAYPPGDSVFIAGSGYQAYETVILQVTQNSGDSLAGDAGDPWIATADEFGNIESYWITPYDEQPGDTLLLSGSGGVSGDEGTTTFIVCPPTNLDQLQNGTTTTSANWSNGNINSSNSCYSEGRSVPYRFFITGLAGETEHYFTVSCQWTNAGIHAFDYFTDYDRTEAVGIAASGGSCGSVSTSPPPDCQAISGSFPFPDPTNTANYSGTIPPDFFPTGFAISGPSNLSFYNATVDSVSKYSFGGTASNRELSLVIYFTVTDTASAGFYWGGHLAQGTPSTWGFGNGSGSISGAPFHMSVGSLDGGGGASQDRSIQSGTICLPPDATITCSSDSVCTNSTYTCSAPLGADSYNWSITGGYIVSGQGTSSISYTTTADYPGTVIIALEACDNTDLCPGDNCCNVDTVEIVVGNCCDPPAAICPGDTTIFVCDLNQICLPGFDCNGTATVTGGTLNGNEVCFTPVEGLNTITLVCSNDCGQADTCITNVTVVLNTPPAITCPSDITIACNESSDPSNTGTATATDDHDPSPAISYWDSEASGSCPQEKTITRTWVAIDECNDSSTCVQTITVEDNVAPTITCPADVAIDCNASTDPANTGTATATDNCDPAPTVTYSDSQIGNVITRTWTATDACSNSSQCIQTITIQDTTPPTITCPADVTIACDASTDPANTGTATATDNCDPAPTVTYSDSEVQGSCPQEKTITRTWTATDAGNNSSQCVQTIIVEDNAAPTITCPADVAIDCNASTDPANTGTATAIDNCDPAPTVTYSDSQVGNVITRTWTATDACSNSSQCIQTITIQDTTPPTITCPAAVTIACDASTDPANTGTATATDDCDPAPTVTYSDSEVQGSCPQEKTITRTWTATDAGNNSSQCVQTITVEDNVAPTITCPADVAIDCNASTDPSNTGTATATDNCDPAPTVTYSDSQVGNVITRTWTATDACSNSSQCIQTITIQDTTPPTITCPAAVTIACDESTDPANTGTATATDNCDPAPTVTYSDSEVQGSCPQEKTITRTWTATDAGNNSSQCVQTITVEDNVAPVCSVPGDTTIAQCEGTEVCLPISAIDNCDDTVACQITAGPGTLSGGNWCYTPSASGPVMVTIQCQDDCGNSCEQSFTVTFELNSPPITSCPNDTTILVCDLSAIILSGFDCSDPDDNLVSCEVDNGTLSDSAVTFTPIAGVNTITLTAIDGCGATDDCMTTITVVLNSAPVAQCPDDTSIFMCDLSEICLDGFDCSDPDGNLASSTITGGILNDGVVCFTPVEGINTLTLICTDVCGLADTCVTVVTVELNAPPIADVGPDQTIHNVIPSTEICWSAGCSDPDDNLTGCELISATGTFDGFEICFIPPESGTYEFILGATDGCGRLINYDTAVVTVIFNEPPDVQVAASDTTKFCGPNGNHQICVPFIVTDSDDNVKSVTVTGSLPTSVNYNFDTGSGTFCFDPPAIDDVYTFTITAEDSCGAKGHAVHEHWVFVDLACDTATCIIVEIEDTECLPTGSVGSINILVDAITEEMAGFDLLIAYDASAFTFLSAQIGDAVNTWEYFTYRFGPFGNCGDQCPSGLMRIVSIADVNNGPNHPDPAQFSPDGILAKLIFRITSDQTLAGFTYAVDFFWIDCGDNAISSVSGDTLFIDKVVYNTDNSILWHEFDEINYPEIERIPHVGAPDECMVGDKTEPRRCVDFINGTICIIHPDSIDDRGDMNLNHISNEIADAVVYTNFFLFGISALDINITAQTAASDINNDGQTLTVGDLVYLIRIITGDALPYAKLAPFAAEAEISIMNGSLTTTTSVEIGAMWALYDVTGDYSITNHTDMELVSNKKDGQLRVLLYSGLENTTNRIAAGLNELFTISGDVELLRVEVSGYNGNMLESKVEKIHLPTEFALKQNVPNPFNPTTKITLDLPVVSDWRIDIYNITGQLVESFSGNDIGSMTVTWDASQVASGIYFYKATAGSFTATRKMVLMK